MVANMFCNKLWIVLTLLFGCACSSTAKTLPYQLDCDLGKGNSQTLRVQSVTVRLIHGGGTCHVEVFDLHGKLLFEHAANGMQVSSALGPTDERQNFFVIQDDSSPTQLFVIGLGPHPQVFETVKNGYGFWIDKGCADGNRHVWTADDAFQGDPELADVYHQDLFVPEVALDLRGNKLAEITPRCKSHFDRRIAGIRAAMTAQEIDAFKNHRIKDAFRSGQVKGYILYIVFADLYSGRGKIARDDLHRMWPADDEQRLWEWIMQKRSEGILARLDTAATR
jgi:hypothetical protein